jgi:hypothetical protein
MDTQQSIKNPNVNNRIENFPPTDDSTEDFISFRSLLSPGKFLNNGTCAQDSCELVFQLYHVISIKMVL